MKIFKSSFSWSGSRDFCLHYILMRNGQQRKIKRTNNMIRKYMEFLFVYKVQRKTVSEGV
jgi:hypothetical protein